MRGSNKNERFRSTNFGHVFVDPNVVAHHKSSLGSVLPYNDEEWLNKRSWNYGVLIYDVLASIIYPTERIGFFDVKWDYSKATHSQGFREELFHYPAMYLNDAILPNAEIRPGLEYLYGGVPDNIEIASKICGEFCGELCRGTMAGICNRRKSLLTGPPKVDWILANFEEKHNFTKQLLGFHEKHKDYLDSIRSTDFKPRLLIDAANMNDSALS